jgi:hypothetical protein
MFSTDSFIDAEVRYRAERARRDWGTRPSRRKNR